ncbi:MAG: glycosyltransferase family A protein [Actinomycetes bacterium]
MNSHTPAISVIMPIFNRMEFLGASLASISRQTCTDFEVILVDAGSTEPVPAVVNTFIGDDPRFRLIVSPARLDSAQARNAALALAQAPVVAVLDSDDVMVPHRLERQLQLLADEPDVVAVGGGMSTVDENGLAWIKTKNPGDGRVADTPERVHWLMPFRSPTLSSTLTVRTEVLRAVGGFDEAHPLCDDYGTIWKLTEAGKFLMVHDKLSTYRLHSKQVSSTVRGRQAMQVALLRRSIMMSRLDHSIDLKVVIAAAGGPSPTDETSAAAEAVCDELLVWAIAQRHLSHEDREWIEHDHTRRVHDIHETAAKRSGPATTPQPSQ